MYSSYINILIFNFDLAYLNCIYNRLHENEPPYSKQVEDIKKNKNENINLGNVHFFDLCFIIVWGCKLNCMGM
jgi:hypothetical protein